MKSLCDLTEYTATNQFLSRAIDQLGLSQETGCLLAMPHREVSIELPLRRDNGQLDVYYGFRVQHNHARGPFKGGLRFHPQLDLVEARELASAMTWKTALAGIPFGGGKGGINCDPGDLSPSEKEQLTKRFIQRLGSLIGPDKDIPAPDMGTGPREMAWIYEAYARQEGNHWAVVTGKPPALQGCAGRIGATGRGVSIVTKKAAEYQGIDLNGATVAIQGFGKVGRVAASLLEEAGAKIVAISDSSKAIVDEDGIDIADISRKLRQDDAVHLGDVEWEGESIEGDKLLELDCDILIPAAVGHVITEDNVNAISARLIVEAANLPTTFGADEALCRRGITVVPDILANAGGVIVSYLEWTQNHQRRRFAEEDVNRELDNIVQTSWDAVRERMEDGQIPIRDAAYQIAVERVYEAIELRGF